MKKLNQKEIITLFLQFHFVIKKTKEKRSERKTVRQRLSYFESLFKDKALKNELFKKTGICEKDLQKLFFSRSGDPPVQLLGFLLEKFKVSTNWILAGKGDRYAFELDSKVRSNIEKHFDEYEKRKGFEFPGEFDNYIEPLYKYLLGNPDLESAMKMLYMVATLPDPGPRDYVSDEIIKEALSIGV